MIARWQRPTGFRSHFCTRCGAPVPNMLRDTGYVWVPSGLLDGDGELEIGVQLFIDSRAPWARLHAGGHRFAESPSMMELIALLHAKSPPR